MSLKKELIGKKIEGFKFESNEILNYNEDMDEFIGAEGTISEYIAESDSFQVEFIEEYWSYPADLIEEYLLPNQGNLIK